MDLTAVFDRVERGWMFKSIISRCPEGFNQTLVELMETLYANTTTALAESPNDIFELNTGVRQGGPESPMLYNLFMDFIMRIFLEKCKIKAIKFLSMKYKIPRSASTTGREAIGEFNLDWVGYADDLMLTFDDKDSLQQGIFLLDKILTRYRSKM